MRLSQDVEILKRRDEVYKAARQKRPERWSGETRDWARIDQVALNPTHEEMRNTVEEKNDNFLDNYRPIFYSKRRLLGTISRRLLSVFQGPLVQQPLLMGGVTGILGGLLQVRVFIALI